MGEVNVIENFLNKIQLDNKSGCWNWIASKNKNGYGYFGFKGKVQKSHRVSYQIYIGEIPLNFKILHRCDNTSCVSPFHLFVGTQKDNVDDMILKNRQYDKSGINGTNRKLSEAQIRYIRIYKNITTTEIGKLFNISVGYVSKIRNNLHWKK